MRVYARLFLSFSLSAVELTAACDGTLPPSIMRREDAGSREDCAYRVSGIFGSMLGLGK